MYVVVHTSARMKSRKVLSSPPTERLRWTAGDSATRAVLVMTASTLIHSNASCKATRNTRRIRHVFIRLTVYYSMQQEITIIYTIILLKSVGVRKLQVAILAWSSREMSLTVRIVWEYIPSRVRVSVRPSIFCIREKSSINYHESRPSCIWLLNGQAAPVTMRSRLNGQRPVGAESTVVILSRTDWPKTAKINQSKRRQWEFIHSRLEQCGLGIITWPMRL